MHWDISGRRYRDFLGMNGILIDIHPHDKPTRDLRNMVLIEPGVFTRITIKKVEKYRLHPPFDPSCGALPFKIVTNYPYSRQVCELDCILKAQLDRCGCVANVIPGCVEKGVPICNVTEMRCTFKVSARSCRDCIKSCPVECRAVEYKIETSRLSLGTDLIYERMGRLPRWKNSSRVEMGTYVKENIVGFSVGFKTLAVEVMTAKPTNDLVGRLSQLGGTMGLLLGFSTITLFEFLFFVFDYVRHGCA